jgi:auxin efflux carrier family protein
MTIMITNLRVKESTFEVVAICFGGWILSRRGILNRSVQKSLSAVNLNLFTPCLIFSKLASSLNLSVLADLWAMPLLFACVCGVSWIVGWGTSRAWGIGRRWEKFVISCSMFQNVNYYPPTPMLVVYADDIVEFVADCDCFEFGLYIG